MTRAAPWPALAGAGALAASGATADEAVVLGLIRDRYRLDGSLTALAGERDSNYRLATAAGEYLIKVTHPDEDASAVAAQWAALVHLEQTAPALPTQRPVLTAAGESGVVYPADPRRRLRVTTFLPGVLRRHAPWQASLAASIGTVAATLDAALQSFAHPGAAQHLLWDLRRAQELRPLLPLLEGDPLAATVLAVLDRHAALLPDLASLPAQPIHNDLNPSNLIVSDDGTHVAGVIDFGDMILAPRVLELAVACAYLTDADDPLQAIAECTHAYAQSLSVSPDELQPLGDLMATRWAMTVLITEWRSRLQPENAAYILRNNAGSRRGLDLYAGDGRARLQQLMKELRR